MIQLRIKQSDQGYSWGLFLDGKQELGFVGLTSGGVGFVDEEAARNSFLNSGWRQAEDGSCYFDELFA